MRRSFIIEIIAAALVIILVYASLSKALAYPVFVAQLHTHPLLKHFAGLLAWAVPAAELAIAALLVIPRTQLIGLYSAAGLLAIFTAYLALMLLMYKNLPCSCGGIISKLGWRGHVVFNGVLIVLAITGIRFAKSERPGKSVFGNG